MLFFLVAGDDLCRSAYLGGGSGRSAQRGRGDGHDPETEVGDAGEGGRPEKEEVLLAVPAVDAAASGAGRTAASGAGRTAASGAGRTVASGLQEVH